MKVNTIHFFLSIYKNLYFCTIEFLEGNKADNFMMAMDHINNLYQSRGVQIMKANMDGEYETIRDGLLGLGITLNTISCNENVPEAEWNVRTVKD